MTSVIRASVVASTLSTTTMRGSANSDGLVSTESMPDW